VDRAKASKALRHDDPALLGRPLVPAAPRGRPSGAFTRRLDQHAPAVFVMPAVLLVLAMSIFPLIVSLYLSLARFRFVQGGFEANYIGWLNYKKLLLGSEQFHFLGDFGQLGGPAWAALGLAAAALIALLFRHARSPRSSFFSVLARSLVAALAWLGLLLIVATNTGGGHPGSLVVTLFYVGIGVAVQYAIGAIIDLFPSTPEGYSPEGYRWGFGVFLGLQLLALLWYLAGRRLLAGADAKA